jgi:hypothetical protein
MSPIAWIVGSATGGLARSNHCFRSVTTSPAAATAAPAAKVARGRLRHLAASPAAPKAAINGHFTHQAEASRKTTVSGCQRRPSANEEAALSQPSSVWNSSGTPPRYRAAEAPAWALRPLDVRSR